MDTSTRYPLQLVDVRLYQAHLKRPDEAGTQEPPEEGLPISIEVGMNRVPPDRVSVFLTLKVQGDEDPFDITLVLEGFFEAACGLDELNDDFWSEFINVSAPSLIWPYARECMSTITWRMRIDSPMLPTLNRLAMAEPVVDAVSPEGTELDSEIAEA